MKARIVAEKLRPKTLAAFRGPIGPQIVAGALTMRLEARVSAGGIAAIMRAVSALA